ncbi:MAG: universal stress protein [Cyanobacteria bacterium J06555_13]
MTNKILVAVFDCATEEYLFNEALRIAKAKGETAELCFLHVLLDGTPPNKQMEAALQTWVTKAEAMRITAKTEIDYGLPGRIICQHASVPLWGANSVVIGHRTRNALTEFALGNVSSYVRKHAPVNCAVLVVRSPLQAVTTYV